MFLKFEKKLIKELYQKKYSNVDIDEVVKEHESSENNNFFDIESLEECCKKNETLHKQYKSLIESFFVYTETVFKYQDIISGDLTDEQINEEFQFLDESRNRIHNGMISDVSILSRLMNREGEEGEWVKKIGDPKNPGHRAYFANFAIQNTLNILSKIKKENIEVDYDEK